MFDRGLKTKLITYTISLILILALSFLVFYMYQMSNLVKNELVNFGTHLSQDLAFSTKSGVASKNPEKIEPALKQFLSKKRVVMTAVYDEEGDPIMFSENSEPFNEIPDSTIRKVVEEGRTIKIEGEAQNGVKVYNFYSPITLKTENKTVGISRVAISLTEIQGQRRKIFKYGSAITFIIILIGSLMAYLIATKITKPIRLLTRGAEEISKGNLSHRIKTKTKGETKELAKTFNQMADNLQKSREKLRETKKVLQIQVKARTKELRRLNQELEDRVRQRTQELQKRVDELERFHRLTIGREMRMIELKKKIKKLKKKLKEKDQGDEIKD